MKVYFITRFSIYDSEFRGFRLTAEHDQKEYERRLFGMERLNHKFELFENITLPSIVEQTSDNWEWLIYISNRMPDVQMQRLRTLVRNYTNIVLIAVRDFREFFEKDLSYNYDESFATVRIDDDDGLNSVYVEKLQQYSEKVGSIISFTEGTLVKYVNRHLMMGERISERNCALGLAGIGLRIYSQGRHSDIENRYNVIYDSTPDMFLLTCSPFTDTKRGFTQFERFLGKLRRLLFLSIHQPCEVPGECAAFIRKRLQR